MNYLLSILLAALETFLFFFILDNLLSKKDAFIKERNVAILAYFLFQLFTYIIDFHFFSTVIYYVVFALAISYYLYYNDLRTKLITTSLFVTLTYAAKLSAALIYLEFSHYPIPSNVFELVLNPLTQFIACAIVFFMICLILLTRKLTSKPTQYVIDFILFVFPLINLSLSMNVLNQKNSTMLYIDISVLLFFYTFFLFFMADQLNYNSEKTFHLELISQQMQLQKQHFIDLTEYNQEIRSIKHDLKNHIRMIRGYLQDDNIEKAIEYINEYDENLHQISKFVFTGNNTVDILLNQKMNLANKQNIHLNYNILIPNEVCIPDLDLCIILSNLLDNAIEATSKVENKTINLKMNIYKEQLFISVSNTFNGSIKQSSNQLLSLKQDKNHGYGLYNVKRVVEKLHGSFNYQFDQNEFVVTILLRL
ncbi:sensor histidine kinase [Anaerorhabdus furcosa]|uniref:Sensor_kinase_SpoOB-type, alpha-helical domain n=1 Tax=Anaerorhabdus furcosa TaxID=118967 RepID=A0A1T4NPE6_9FIRM|nr:sensor histidine kinase [Anaerorhabdus furcosa]SJZ80916.1 Sensor_kinase_SpoOB-type, alpha-helical domain [Anaerorhabdus furcosa]